jgi:acetyl esterase
VPPKPEVQQLLDAVAAMGAPKTSDQTPEVAREAYRALAAMRGEPTDVGAATDRVLSCPVGDVPARVYTPSGGAAPRACLVWLHGGGWVIGDLDAADATCRALCEAVGIVVVSVDYRLAPEHPFPAAFDDCVAATRWVFDHAEELGVDISRVAIGGDSAGGNLAAATCIELRGDLDLQFQLLIYPVTDATLGHPSMDENADGYLLTKDTMAWFVANYIGDGDPKDERVSPLHAGDLSGLPPALVVTAEYDPLRDEGEAYAAALRDAGNEVEVVRYDGQIHAFFGFLGLWPDADVAHERAATALRAALS